MAKKTEKTAVKTKPATKAKAKPTAKAAAAKVGPRHPHGRVVDAHGTKAALAKSLAPAIARADQDAAQLEAQLATASNQQLLRLQQLSARVKEKYGSRDKLIAAIGTAHKQGKDKDFLAKLDSYSLPQLLDLATSSERRARS